MQTFTESNFDTEVKQAPELVLVDFWAAWCGPCNALTPILEKVAARFPAVKFGKVNCMEEQDLANVHNISAIPALHFYKDGQIVKSLVGFQQEKDLVEALEELSK